MKNILYLIILFVLVSCESMIKTIDMDLKDNGRMIVVNSLLQEGDTISASIYKSAYIFDNSKMEILTNAEVKFYENDIFLGTASLNTNGQYVLPQMVQTNATYKIEVTSDGLKDVKASSSMLHSSQIISIDTLSGIDSDGNKVKQCKVKFKDYANEKNYYMLQLRSSTDGLEICIQNFSDYIYSDDISVSQNTYNGILLNDNSFDGSTKDLILNYETIWDDRYYNESEEMSDSLIMSQLILYSINEDLFNYLSSYYQYVENYGFNFFSEPIQVYNNIENGAGIFAPYSTSVDSFARYIHYYTYYGEQPYK